MIMKTNDNGVDREMTEAEQAAHETWAVTAHAEAEAQVEAAEARAAARQAVLDNLGLTADEAAALLG